MCDGYGDADADGDDIFFLLSRSFSLHGKMLVMVFKEMTCRFLLRTQMAFLKILQSRFLFVVNFLGLSQFYWIVQTWNSSKRKKCA